MLNLLTVHWQAFALKSIFSVVPPPYQPVGCLGLFQTSELHGALLDCLLHFCVVAFHQEVSLRWGSNQSPQTQIETGLNNE